MELVEDLEPIYWARILKKTQAINLIREFESMKKLVRKSILPIYVVLIVFLAGARVVSFRNASTILRDHSVIKAPIELVDTSSRTKKGHNFELDDLVLYRD